MKKYSISKNIEILIYIVWTIITIVIRYFVLKSSVIPTAFILFLTLLLLRAGISGLRSGKIFGGKLYASGKDAIIISFLIILFAIFVLFYL